MCSPARLAVYSLGIIGKATRLSSGWERVPLVSGQPDGGWERLEGRPSMHAPGRRIDPTKASRHTVPVIRLEYIKGGSEKFWRAKVTGSTLVVTFGRIGTNGTVKRSELGSAAEARAERDKRAAQKVKKGYLEVTASSSKTAKAKKKAGAKTVTPKTAKKDRTRSPGGSRLDKKLATVQKKVLGGREPPPCLRALWEEQLSNKSRAFFGRALAGEVHLLTKKSEEVHDYLSSADAEIWEAMFEEICWVAEEASGAILGYFHGGKKDLGKAPAIVLDNEGQLRIGGRNFYDHFLGRAEEMALDDEESQAELDRVKAWVKANTKQKPLTHKQRVRLPSPAKRFKELYEAAKRKP